MPIIAGVLFALAVAIFYNRQTIIDRIAAWRFEPSAAISQMATDSGMSNGGKLYFYASQPQLDDSDEFNQNCSQKEMQSIVLGCYAAQRIYIYNVTDERIAGVKTVTAAHEMLHAAYDRLSSNEREKVGKMLEDQLAKTTDQNILDLIKVYDDIEPGQRLNELHSIFGTEVANLAPELETYYKKYFDNRGKVVNEAVKYQSVFDQLKSQQDALSAKLTSEKAEIDSLTRAYEADYAQLSNDIDTFNTRAKTQGGFASQAEFEVARAGLQARQRQLDDDATTINVKIAAYNAGVDSLNALGVEAEKLQNNLNSHSQEI